MRFKHIKNFKNKYLIYENGDVVSLSRKFWNGRCWWTSKDKLLKQHIGKNGYKVVALSIGKGKAKLTYVHRLIAKHFIPNPKKKPFVNHIDGNKLNNSINNLEWVTSQENCIHAFKIGLQKRIQRFGEKNNTSKLKTNQIKEIRSLKGKKMLKEISKQYNISISQISAIQNYNSWKHIK
jgi:hypothetical protein